MGDEAQNTGKLVVRPGDRALERRREEVDLLKREKTVEIVAGVVQLVLRAGHAAIDNGQENAKLEQERERHGLALAKLDAETRAEVERIEASLRGAKEQTARLAMLCDLVATKGRDMPDAVAEGVGRAIAACTEGL